MTATSAQVVSNWKSEIQRRRALLLNYLLVAAAIGGPLAMGPLYLGTREKLSLQEQLAQMLPFLASWLIALIVLAWRSLSFHIRSLSLLLLVYGISVVVFARGGMEGSGRIWLLSLPPLTFALVNLRASIAAGVITALTYAFFPLAISQNWAAFPWGEDPAAVTSLVTEGGTFLLITAAITLILWSLDRAWREAMEKTNTVNLQLQAQTQKLEETNVQLQRQTSHLRATAEISHACSSILEPERLLNEVVNQIQEGFNPLGVYYVGLFLLNETGEDDEDGGEREQRAVLKAATGEAGRLLLDMNYALEVNDASSIGRCIIERQPHVTLDAKDELVQFDALPMPHTRSEIALPLRSRGRVLGALSVHSSQEAAFGEVDIAAVQTMVDQVAVAIDNARLFRQTEVALQEVHAIQRHYQAQAWQDFLARKPVTHVDYAQPGTDAKDGDFLRQAQREAMKRKQAVTAEGAPLPTSNADEETPTPQTALVVPLQLRGQVIGTMSLHEMQKLRSWTPEDVALAEVVAEQVALTVENLRLMDETRRRAAHERVVSEVAGQVRASLDPDTVLKTTVRELARVLGAELATIEVTGPQRDDGDLHGEGSAQAGENGSGSSDMDEGEDTNDSAMV